MSKKDTTVKEEIKKEVIKAVAAKAKKAASPKQAKKAAKALEKKAKKKQEKLDLKLASKNSPDKMLAIMALILSVAGIVLDHLLAEDKKKRNQDADN